MLSFYESLRGEMIHLPSVSKHDGDFQLYHLYLPAMHYGQIRFQKRQVLLFFVDICLKDTHILHTFSNKQGFGNLPIFDLVFLCP